MDKPIYLDYNATTPIDPEVAEAMLPVLYEHFGNPSSAHDYGWAAHSIVEEARRQVAALLNAFPGEIVFTSSGTESNNMVIKGVAEAHSGKGRHMITTAVEHPAILEPCRWLAARGFEITYLPVDADGRVNPAQVEQAIRAETILISVMLANNEIGTIQPVAEIAEAAHRHGVLVHTDAAQALGKIPVDVRALDIDFLSAAGHKLYAPKGVGALYIREGLSLPAFMHGASHEGGRRAGTENVLEIAGLGRAAEIARRDPAGQAAHMQAMRDRLYEGLVTQVPDIRRNSPVGGCLPNTLSVGFGGTEANVLVALLSQTVAVSAGAACHADQVSISAVLQAVGVPFDYARGALRMTVGRMTTAEEIDRAIAAITEGVAKARRR
jgi:cysteine desulfurase